MKNTVNRTTVANGSRVMCNLLLACLMGRDAIEFRVIDTQNLLIIRNETIWAKNQCSLFFTHSNKNLSRNERFDNEIEMLACAKLLSDFSRLQHC